MPSCLNQFRGHFSPARNRDQPKAKRCTRMNPVPRMPENQRVAAITRIWYSYPIGLHRLCLQALLSGVRTLVFDRKSPGVDNVARNNGFSIATSRLSDYTSSGLKYDCLLKHSQATNTTVLITPHKRSSMWSMTPSSYGLAILTGPLILGLMIYRLCWAKQQLTCLVSLVQKPAASYWRIAEATNVVTDTFGRSNWDS